MENTKQSPKDFFLYLLSSFSLYYSAVWLVTLYYQYINHVYPDISNGYSYGAEAVSGLMRWALASLIIVFPLYIVVTHLINKDSDKHPEKRELKIRKWLTYFTLFIAAVTIVIDLIALVFNLLEGDFTVRFILKVSSVLLVSGLIGGYYLYELKSDKGVRTRGRNYFRWTSIILVALSVIGAFFIVGSPVTNRNRQYDAERISDLQSIQWQILNYWQRKQVLPASLADLKDDLSGQIVPRDPKTQEAYEYRATGKLSFELCATFALIGNENQSGRDYTVTAPASIGGGIEESSWQHDAGRTCFTRTIDPQLYPPYKM
jgi:hypothetical protein